MHNMIDDDVFDGECSEGVERLCDVPMFKEREPDRLASLEEMKDPFFVSEEYNNVARFCQWLHGQDYDDPDDGSYSH